LRGTGRCEPLGGAAAHRGKSAADATTTLDFIGTESSGWQTWASVDRAWTHPERCALEGRSEVAFSAGVGLRWPVNPTLSGLTAEGDLVSTMALRKLTPSLHLVDRVKS
jgi:hypothetical protein